jgi:hypothetical protein
LKSSEPPQVTSIKKGKEKMSGIDLLITGLCSFVPKYPLVDGEQCQDNEITVLLAESYKPVPGHSSHTHGEPHVPVLVCPEKYVVYGEGLRAPDAMFQPTPYPLNQDYTDLMAIFYLDDQQITIEPHTLNELNVHFGEVKDCPQSDLTSFQWVAPLAEVNPGSERVRASCLSPECDPSVISRLQLRQGTVTTAKLATNIKRKVLLWYFDETDKYHRKHRRKGGRAIAATVGVHFDLDEACITFKTSLLREYGGGYRTSANRRVEAIFGCDPEMSLPIVLEPVGIEVPKVWIKNVPWPDILQIRRLRDPRCDAHFAHIYKFCEYPVQVRKKVPCTTGETCRGSDDPRHGAGTDCPHARTEAIYPSPEYKEKGTYNG